MHKLLKIAFVLLPLALLMVVACSDRGTNVPEVPLEDQVDRWGIDPSGNHVFAPPSTDPQYSPQLIVQLRNPDNLQEMALYIPRASFPAPTGESKRIPLLVLLAPQDGDKFFYFNHGLAGLANEMIESGEIQPMAIACLASDPTFGGYFWGNSYPAGFYDDIIADPSGDGLIAHLNNIIPALIDDPAKRGIGGVGMGAYGAFRHALKHPDQYGSITVTDGPLDFDGADGNSGLISLFDNALTEQGLGAADFQDFDTTTAWALSRMIIGGSVAFSPRDTTVFYRIQISGGTRRTVFIDSTYTYGDNTTLVDSLILDQGRLWGFMLPFDGTGSPYAPVWNRWMDNDLEALLTDAGAGALNGVNMWFGTTPEAQWGYYNMTESWISTLRTSGYTPEVKLYGGYDGKPATGSEYMYDLLREMLIFHSESFGD